MHKLDQYGRVINEYGQLMGYNNYPNWCFPDIKKNPCAEIDLVQERIRQIKEKENKYLLIRR